MAQPLFRPAFRRHSSGPLYSARELARAGEILGQQGYVHKDSTVVMGETVWIYERADDDGRKSQAIVYVGAGENSGAMFLPGEKNNVRGTTVWAFVRDHDGGAVAGVLKSVRSRLFPG